MSFSTPLSGGLKFVTGRILPYNNAIGQTKTTIRVVHAWFGCGGGEGGEGQWEQNLLPK